MAKPKKETLRHRQAFDAYLALGSDRSYKAVAEKFKVSETAVAGWSLAFRWGERLSESENRIAERSSQLVESELAKFDAKLLITAKNVLILFAKRLEGAVDEDGNLKPKGYKPGALDAKIWAELGRQIMMKGESGQLDGLQDFEGVQVEQIERVLVERTTRLVKARKRGDIGGGF